MKKSLFSVVAIFVLFLISGCTQNHGDIGPLFGFWRLTGLTCNGDPVDGYESGDEIWSFQNNIIFIQTLGEAHGYEERAGTWSRRDNILELDFTHWQGQGDMEYYYRAPAILRFSADEVNPLTIEALTSKEMSLKLIGADGSLMSYTLKKVY